MFFRADVSVCVLVKLKIELDLGFWSLIRCTPDLDSHRSVASLLFCFGSVLLSFYRFE